MKTLGRIFMILAAFALVMGITYIAVNAQTAGSSTNAQRFEDGGFPRPGGGERPEFQDGQRPEFRGERGGGLIFGAIKNIGIVAIIVALIMVPKGWLQRRKRAAQVVS